MLFKDIPIYPHRELKKQANYESDRNRIMKVAVFIMKVNVLFMKATVFIMKVTVRSAVFFTYIK
ncbi:hypothetical protein BED42_19475 [Citrobacter portucalensis]|nr:hypothetical protein BED30_16850 [Citrobacter portucalensis]OIY07897.1 hypothetical protein BED42_19475 [Citrobacter portucalensis]